MVLDGMEWSKKKTLEQNLLYALFTSYLLVVHAYLYAALLAICQWQNKTFAIFQTHLALIRKVVIVCNYY